MALVQKTSAPKSAKSDFYTVITVAPEDSAIKFFSMTEGQKASIKMETKKCKTRLFDDEFFEVFEKLVNEYAAQHPSSQAAGVTLVLPDRGAATDILSIPTLKKKRTEESLTVAINDLYKNSDELKINRAVMSQNKQYTSYYVSIMQNSLLSRFMTILATAKMIPQAVTFASNTTVNSVASLNPKLKSGTYMVMDIKSSFTRIAFVSKGLTCGYYTLPFGYSILEHNTLAAEDMLLSSPEAELIVLNAKEKAKAKQLTMMNYENAQNMAQTLAEEEEQATALNEAANAREDTEDEEDFEENSGDVFTNGNSSVLQAQTNTVIKTLPKKQPRKLPKFMLRPAPHGEEEYSYENFRLFVKWALNLIQTNKSKLWHEKPEAVYVNMPEDYGFLFEKVNEEKKENGISFEPLNLSGSGEKVFNNLESYGGFFTSEFNLQNNF